MLNEKELREENSIAFMDFLESRVCSDEDLNQTTSEFVVWFNKHRNQLMELCPDMNNFTSWARVKYINWSYHQANKELKSEIDDITKIKL